MSGPKPVNRSSVVVDTSRSPYARLRPVPICAVTIEDQFWAPRRQINRETTLPAQYRMLWSTGRFDNFLRVAGKHDGPFQGRFFNDSDVYKWLEAACWELASGLDPALQQAIDEAIAVIGAAQRPDGYLNTYFALERADERWSDPDLHEMYCAGHLFQAAVAHCRVTGSRDLLDIAIRFAEHIDATFGPERAKRVGSDGHPEVEMALVELSRETGDERYRQLAGFLLDVRGHGLLGDAYDRFGSAYHQDHVPFRETDEIVGHAVRAVYLNAGAADLYAETGEPALLETLHRLWTNMTGRKMYVSGGLGSRHEGEAFGADYELPNRLAYAETCAAVGSIMWNWRMLAIEGDARFADLIELQLYNAMLAGVSLDGQTYFYENRLADDGNHRRSEWFHVACCPPNVARTLASLPGYVYSVAASEIWVHLFIESSSAISLPDDRVIRLRQTTAYPWDGVVDLHIETSGSFGLRVRIPGWCDEPVQISINGEPIDQPTEAGTYLHLDRDWNDGDIVRIELPMPVRKIACHPKVEENTGRVALMRGPLLYCLEAVDNSVIDIDRVWLPTHDSIQATFRPDLFGGVIVLTGSVVIDGSVDWHDLLYRPVQSPETNTATPKDITAIPYYAWANRDPGWMLVWIRTQ